MIGAKWYLVEILHCFKVLAVAAGVGEAHANAAAQIPFDGHVPLLHGGIFVMDRKGVVEVGCSCCAAGS